MALKVKGLLCLSLASAGKATGLVTLLTALFNIVDLIELWINYETEGPRTHKYIIFPPDEDLIKWSLLAHIIVFFSGLFLVIGTVKKIYRLLLPWIILFILAIVFGIVWIGVFFIFAVGNWDNIFGVLFLLAGFGIFLVTGLGIYVWLAIFSLYRIIRDEKRSGKLSPVDAESLYPQLQSHYIVKTSYLQQSPDEAQNIIKS